MVRNNKPSTVLARLKSAGLATSGLKLTKDEGIEVNVPALIAMDLDTDEAADAVINAVEALCQANPDSFDNNAEAPVIRLLARGLTTDDLTIARSIAACLGGKIRQSSDLTCFARFVPCTDKLGWSKPATTDWRQGLARFK